MAYTRISHTAFGRAALKYAKGFDGNGHNNKAVRNQLITGVNMFPETVASYEDQMEKFWRKKSSRNKNEVRRIVQSFSLKELDPHNPADVETANRVGVEFAEVAYPGHQAVVFTQTDGKSGLIHNHIIVSNVNMFTYKGCTDEQTKFTYVKQYTNEVASKYFELDAGENHEHDKITQSERHKRQRNAENEEANKSLPADKQKKMEYIWKDDLKSRVRKAMEQAKSRDGFAELLTASGVECDIRTRKNGTEYVVYELIDTTGFGDGKVPKNLKAKGTKMGMDYDLDELDTCIKRNKAKSVQKPVVYEQKIPVFIPPEEIIRPLPVAEEIVPYYGTKTSYELIQEEIVQHEDKGGSLPEKTPVFDEKEDGNEGLTRLPEEELVEVIEPVTKVEPVIEEQIQVSINQPDNSDVIEQQKAKYEMMKRMQRNNRHISALRRDGLDLSNIKWDREKDDFQYGE